MANFLYVSNAGVPEGEFLSNVQGTMFFEDMTSIMGVKAANSVQRCSSKGLGVSG